MPQGKSLRDTIRTRGSGGYRFGTDATLTALRIGMTTDSAAGAGWIKPVPAKATDATSMEIKRRFAVMSQPSAQNPTPIIGRPPPPPPE
jgi:hypothetical protein